MRQIVHPPGAVENRPFLINNHEISRQTIGELHLNRLLVSADSNRLYNTLTASKKKRSKMLFEKKNAPNCAYLPYLSHLNFIMSSTWLGFLNWHAKGNSGEFQESVCATSNPISFSLIEALLSHKKITSS
jgi:hypothetical protein